jgi:pilus assembly protein TadC
MKNSFMKLIAKRIFPFGTSLVLTLLFVFLSGCRVRPSFSYAFFGTFLIMGVALVIATVVTRRAKRNREE